MNLLNRRSGTLFVVGFLSILITRTVFRLLSGIVPVVHLAMIATAAIAASIVALAFEFWMQKQGK